MIERTNALSWRTPQKLATFEETSPYYGLSIPPDVLVSRQVLADADALDVGEVDQLLGAQGGGRRWNIRVRPAGSKPSRS